MKLTESIETGLSPCSRRTTPGNSNHTARPIQGIPPQSCGFGDEGLLSALLVEFTEDRTVANGCLSNDEGEYIPLIGHGPAVSSSPVPSQAICDRDLGRRKFATVFTLVLRVLRDFVADLLNSEEG
jgi:hypothetical protein